MAPHTLHTRPQSAAEFLKDASAPPELPTPHLLLPLLLPAPLLQHAHRKTKPNTLGTPWKTSTTKCSVKRQGENFSPRGICVCKVIHTQDLKLSSNNKVYKIEEKSPSLYPLLARS